MSTAYGQQIIIVPTTTVTANGTGSEINIPQAFSSAILYLNVSAASGTSPTLDVKIQDVLQLPAAADAILAQPTGTKVYDDFGAFTQMTAAGTSVMRLGSSSFTATGAVATVALALQDGTMTAGTGKVGPVGLKWRPKWILTATTPSFTFTITGQFLWL